MQTKLSITQVKKVRRLSAQGWPQRKIAKLLKCSQTAVSFILTGKTYQKVA